MRSPVFNLFEKYGYAFIWTCVHDAYHS